MKDTDIWITRKKQQNHESLLGKPNYLEFPNGEWALYNDSVIYINEEKWVRTKDGPIEGFRRANTPTTKYNVESSGSIQKVSRP